jgi:DNA-binding MarR family transcriptional regulator
MDQESFRKRISEILRDQLGVEDASGLELHTTLHRADVLSSAFDTQGQEEAGLSGPRWWLMLRLFLDEEMGNTTGLTPSFLSHSQRVSRNTISALLRGLEEQGLIHRVMDPNDLRTFRIKLSDEGSRVIRRSAPERIERLNRLYSILTNEERGSLLLILNKLTRVLMEQHCHRHNETDDNEGQHHANSSQE